MGLKLTNGVYPLTAKGLPQEATASEELLQNVSMRLTMRKGDFPYDRELGAALATVTYTDDHAVDQVVALANEALMDVPGVSATNAAFLSSGQRIRFYLDTPLGEEILIVTPVR